jgi:hypothetical protein
VTCAKPSRPLTSSTARNRCSASVRRPRSRRTAASPTCAIASDAPAQERRCSCSARPPSPLPGAAPQRARTALRRSRRALPADDAPRLVGLRPGSLVRRIDQQDRLVDRERLLRPLAPILHRPRLLLKLRHAQARLFQGGELKGAGECEHSCIAAVCRSTCGVIVLAASDGHVAVAIAACSRWGTAAVRRRRPRGRRSCRCARASRRANPARKTRCRR